MRDNDSNPHEIIVCMIIKVYLTGNGLPGSLSDPKDLQFRSPVSVCGIVAGWGEDQAVVRDSEERK